MKKLIAAIMTATMIPLAACTSGTDPKPTGTGTSSTTPATPPALSTTDDRPPTRPTTLASMTSSTSVATSSSPRPTSQTSVTSSASPEWPVNISPTISGAELQAVDAAVEVWRAAMRLYDESMQRPGETWAPKIRRYVADPAATVQINLLDTLHREGIRQIGNLSYTATITKATASNVQIRACVDLARSDVINGKGDSVAKPNAHSRFYRDFNVDYYKDAGAVWLLNLITTPQPVEPC